MKRLNFPSEAALCEAFIETVPKQWTVYPETCGFDIMLVHETGVQIGVEAKQSLNAKVICQALDGHGHYYRDDGPDFRAVLVPAAGRELAEIARRLHLTILTMEHREKHVSYWDRNQGKTWLSRPALPEIKKAEHHADRWLDRTSWYDFAPTQRCVLPEYVPEVAAGVSAPLKLTQWKINAIKVCVVVERLGSIHRRDFKKLKVSPSMWTTGVWLKKSQTRGWWMPGSHFPAAQFRHEHPSVFAQIETDFEKWTTEAGLDASRPKQGELL